MATNLLISHARLKGRGFSLVEVLVALVIGMIGILVMMQVFSLSEGQKRSTTGASDAQSSGAMALYMLQRDIRQAGYGVSTRNMLGCPLVVPTRASPPLSQLAPVIINPPTDDVPAGDANTDTLLVIYGSGAGAPEGDAIVAVNASQIGVQGSAHYSVGDFVIAAPNAPLDGCSLTLASVASKENTNVQVASSGAIEGGRLFNLGPTPRILAYAVRRGALTVCDYMAANCGAACTATDGTCSANWVPIANNVVSFRAQYGHASTALSGVDTWDQATPPLSTPTKDAHSCLWARTSAIRLAIVTRNNQPDRDVVTAVDPTWDGSAAAPVNLSGTRVDWQNYRYRVQETTVPIRNVPWMESC